MRCKVGTGVCNNLLSVESADAKEQDILFKHKGKSIQLMFADKNQQCLEKKLKRAMDALLWCSGSADFAPLGIARKAWEAKVKPILEEECV